MAFRHSIDTNFKREYLMGTRSDILKQLYLVLIGFCLIFLFDYEKIHWIGWAFIIEYIRRLILYSYSQFKEKNNEQSQR